MRLAVLGPLVVSSEGGEIPVTPRKAREVLTLLALEHPRPLSLEALIDGLWDEPPAAAAKTVQAHLSRLRRVLLAAGAPPPGIAGGPRGYHFSDPGWLDVGELGELSAAASRSLAVGAWAVAVDSLARAQRLFRGPPELPDTARGEAARAWLDELRSTICEDHAEALIRAGRAAEGLAELERLTADDPLRERLWQLRMLALASSGRAADALRAYADARAHLVEELGIEPGPALRAAEHDVLEGRAPTVAPRRPPEGRSPVPTPSQRQMTPAIKYVAVDDVHVAWCSIGDAEADIVILNPGTLPVDCVGTEPRFAAAVESVASFARVTWFDRRGIGLSDRCTADRLPSIEDWQRDLRAVLDAVGTRAPVLLASEDTVAVALAFAADHPERASGVVLTNASARFTRASDYPWGLDPGIADQSAAEVAAAEPDPGGFDLLRVIAPSVADDARFRQWWDDSGRRGASPTVARALRMRHHNADMRSLLGRVTVPVLHAVNPTAPAHDRGHDRYLEKHLACVETVELPGPDELWWLDQSGQFIETLAGFVQSVTR